MRAMLLPLMLVLLLRLLVVVRVMVRQRVGSIGARSVSAKLARTRSVIATGADGRVRRPGHLVAMVLDAESVGRSTVGLRWRRVGARVGVLQQGDGRVMVGVERVAAWVGGGRRRHRRRPGPVQSEARRFVHAE